MLPITVTLRADQQIQKAASWWLANRPKAPEAFKEALQSPALPTISLTPLRQ
jgi:hypothetical protein